MDWIKEKYARGDELALERGGLFEALWRRHECIASVGPEPDGVAYWDHAGSGQLYYRVVELTPQEEITESLLILYLDPWLSPPYLIEDYLRKLPQHPGPWSLLLKFGEFSPNKHAEYIHRVYGLLRAYIPVHAQMDGPQVLLKRLSYRGVRFFAPGLEWFFGDPWIEHFLLSRGARRGVLFSRPELKVNQTVPLSDLHAIEIGELVSGGDRYQIDLVRKMSPDWRAMRSVTNSLGVPDSFLNLCYRNLLRD